MKNAPLLNLVLSVVLLISVGWLLYVGRPILLPILTAVISVYVVIAASEALGRLPVFRLMPGFVRRFITLVAFAAFVLVFAVVVAATVRDIVAAAPIYEANLDVLLEEIAARFNIETETIWEEMQAVTIDRIDIQQVALVVLGGFTTVGTTIFLVIVYAAFLIAERGGFAAKIAAALQDEDRARVTLDIITEINRRISDYLAIKTLINLILGVLSFVVLTLMGVDFALFWAITIALLNYIPYVGSYIGVAFPVVLSLAQFGSVPTTILLAVLLIAVQTFVGNFLEPRMIGRQMNLSPFVVLVALSVWASIWGIPGAILAVPMTSVLAIVLSSFPTTRFLAVLLAERPDGSAGPAQDTRREPVA